MSCSDGAGWCPVISDCKLLGASGINKMDKNLIMNMATHLALASWHQPDLTPALADGVPRDKIGAGLGEVWNATRTVHAWNLKVKNHRAGPAKFAS